MQATSTGWGQDDMLDWEAHATRQVCKTQLSDVLLTADG